jgi:hypothetical protein
MPVSIAVGAAEAVVVVSLELLGVGVIDDMGGLLAPGRHGGSVSWSAQHATPIRTPR